ncbi:MAG: hypothetical protein WDZ49_07825 [Litorilinea sp.]
MYGIRTPRAIAEHWQAVIATELEAGVTPILQAGGSVHFLPNAAALLALIQASARRDDPARPVVIAGGGLWSAALFAPRVLHTQPGAAFPAVYYGGDDDATAMACVLTWIDGVTPSAYAVHPKLHHLFDAYVVPAHHPGTAVRADTLPLDVTGPLAVRGPLDGAAFASGAGLADRAADRDTGGDTGDNPDGSADWMAWAILVLAVLLPLLAMVV